MSAGKDIEYVNHGSIVTMFPLSQEASDWCLDNIADDAMTFGGAICIEPRYFGEIAWAAQEAGLTSNVRVELA